MHALQSHAQDVISRPERKNHFNSLLFGADKRRNCREIKESQKQFAWNCSRRVCFAKRLPLERRRRLRRLVFGAV